MVLSLTNSIGVEEEAAGSRMRINIAISAHRELNAIHGSNSCSFCLSLPSLRLFSSTNMSTKIEQKSESPKTKRLVGIFTHLDFVSVVTKQGLINEYRPWDVDKLGLCKFE